MKLLSRVLILISMFTASTTIAQVVPLGPPMSSGSGDLGMKHAGVSLIGSTLGVSLVSPPASPVTMTDHGFGIDYTDPKFDVLEDVSYNAQQGWVPDGFISLPANRFIWIERTGATQPAGSTLKVYDGGNMLPGVETMADWSMAEIYASNGETWQWDGIMQHDYFTANLPGEYSMSFKVYVGDAAGLEDTGYSPASATFEFVVVPEPSTLALFLLAGFSFSWRR